jgi:hypothetical protein
MMAIGKALGNCLGRHVLNPVREEASLLRSLGVTILVFGFKFVSDARQRECFKICKIVVCASYETQVARVPTGVEPARPIVGVIPAARLCSSPTLCWWLTRSDAPETCVF